MDLVTRLWTIGKKKPAISNGFCSSPDCAGLCFGGVQGITLIFIYLNIKGITSLLRKCHTCFFLSFLRKQESSEVKGFWTPASAGVTAFL